MIKFIELSDFDTPSIKHLDSKEELDKLKEVTRECLGLSILFTSEFNRFVFQTRKISVTTHKNFNYDLYAFIIYAITDGIQIISSIVGNIENRYTAGNTLQLLVRELENLYRNCIVIKKNLNIAKVSFVGMEILDEILKTIQKIGFEREVQVIGKNQGLLD
jgi:hypothetical protein